MEQLDFFVKLEEKKPICRVCGNDFEKTRRWQKYCSKSCKHRKLRIKKKLSNFVKLEENKPICSICGNSFEKTKHNKIYCSKSCKHRQGWIKNKKTKSISNKKYRLINKKKIKERRIETSKIYREKNKEEIKKKQLEFYKKNKKRLCEIQKEYRKNNKNSISETKKLYRKNNRTKINQNLKEKYCTDFSFKLSQILRKRLRNGLRAQKTTKTNKTVDLIGCSFDFVKIHLEKQFKEGMTWENHGLYGWHIDHIIPCASFDLTDPEQQKKCFHYTNLQPLWAAENMSKGAKIL